MNTVAQIAPRQSWATLPTMGRANEASVIRAHALAAVTAASRMVRPWEARASAWTILRISSASPKTKSSMATPKIWDRMRRDWASGSVQHCFSATRVGLKTSASHAEALLEKVPFSPCVHGCARQRSCGPSFRPFVLMVRLQAWTMGAILSVKICNMPIYLLV